MGRARSKVVGLALALGLTLGLTVFASSCTVSSVDLSQCDYVVTRCRPVYSSWCDGYGCYPTYYEQCWQDCYVDPNKPAPQPTTPAPPVTDAAPPPAGDASAPPPEGDASTGDAGGSLCLACTSNDECGPGGLCIVRGGSAGQAGFCGRPCTGSASSSDCPAGYACSALGSTSQCLPVSGTCP